MTARGEPSRLTSIVMIEKLYIGTSGYSYPEWVDAGFYPPGTSGKVMLESYAKRFAAVELNYTWYQMPRPNAIERLAIRAPQGFVYTAKLTRTMTHEIDPGGWRTQVKQYREGITPLVLDRRLLAILIQLGPRFGRTVENRKYLARLLDELAALPLAVEFRNRSWADDRVFAGLEHRRVSLVAVDAPDVNAMFPRLDVVTNPDLFYVRMHGRNAGGWGSGNKQLQFDYDYTEKDLALWSRDLIPRMADRAKTGVVFFNNHVRGQAPRNARLLTDQLEAEGFSPVTCG